MNKIPKISAMVLYPCLILSVVFGLSQSQAQVKAKSADVFEELETGNLTLRFFNAVSGLPIEKGNVTIGTGVDFVTDEEGKIMFPAPEADGLTTVRFTADGYLPTEFTVEIMAGTIFFNRISISPVMDIKSLRVVLDWDKEPLDLDAHFIKNGVYHLSYRNMRVLADGSGMLDIDAMNGYGPETITVKEVATQSGYDYTVIDYSNLHNKTSRALSRSKATVKVYGEGKLLNVFQVPRDTEGNVWKVFTIVQGQIREVRQMARN